MDGIFKLQVHRSYIIDIKKTYLALKLKFVKGHVFETYKTKAVKTEHNEEPMRMRKRTKIKRLQLLPLLI